MEQLSTTNVNYYSRIDEENSSKNAFNIIYFNAQSLRNKLNDLEFVLSQFKYKIHIIVITETWLKADENKFYNLVGYNAFHSNRKQKIGGGVTIFTSNDLIVSKVFEEEFCLCNFLILKLHQLNIHIAGIYRPPSSVLNTFFEKFENILCNFSSSILVGDFNINLINSSDVYVKNYTNIIHSNGYIILNSLSPSYCTRESNSIQTIIDHIVTDCANFYYNLAIEYKNIGDHKSMLLNFCTSLPSPKYKEINFKVLDYDAIPNDLNFANLSLDFDSLTNHLKDIIKTCTKTVIKKNLICLNHGLILNFLN